MKWLGNFDRRQWRNVHRWLHSLILKLCWDGVMIWKDTLLILPTRSTVVLQLIGGRESCKIYIVGKSRLSRVRWSEKLTYRESGINLEYFEKEYFLMDFKSQEHEVNYITKHGRDKTTVQLQGPAQFRSALAIVLLSVATYQGSIPRRGSNLYFQTKQR